jgi:hypothetical protein
VERVKTIKETKEQKLKTENPREAMARERMRALAERAERSWASHKGQRANLL